MANLHLEGQVTKIAVSLAYAQGFVPLADLETEKLEPPSLGEEAHPKSAGSCGGDSGLLVLLIVVIVERLLSCRPLLAENQQVSCR